MQCSSLCITLSRYVFLLCFFLLLAKQVKAEQANVNDQGMPAAHVVRVTWSDILRAIDKHPGLAARQYEIAAADKGVNAASAVPNPVFEGSIGKSKAHESSDSQMEWELALSMPLDWVFHRGSQIETAKAKVAVAQAETAALRRDVVLALQTLFWNVIFEQARVIALESQMKQTEQLVDIVKKRVEKGEARPIEATRVEIEIEHVASNLEAARMTQSACQAELALWVSIPSDTQLQAIADMNVLKSVISRETALARIRANHPSQMLAKAQTDLLKAELSAEKKAIIPSLSLTGFTSSEIDKQGYGIGITMDVPLWNWHVSSITQAEARLAAGSKLETLTAMELEASVISAQAACEASSKTALNLKNSIIPHSETIASTIEKTYQLGETNLLDVIEARRSLLETHEQYLIALAQSQIDCSRLMILIGEDLK